MPRFAYADPSGLSESKQKMLRMVPANVMRMLANASDPVFDGFSAISGAFMSADSPLPAKLREIAILRVGYLSNAAYEVFQHEALARHVGLTDAQIVMLSATSASLSDCLQENKVRSRRKERNFFIVAS